MPLIALSSFVVEPRALKDERIPERLTLNRAYVEAFTRPGYAPVVLPQFSLPHFTVDTRADFDQAFGDQVREYAERFDALVLTGGQDLHPLAVGFPHVTKHSNGSDMMRDLTEQALARAFMEAHKPILGICRGHQLLGLMVGMTGFYTELGAEEVHAASSVDYLSRQEPVHHVAIRGRFRDYVQGRWGAGIDRLSWTSHHHQGYRIPDDKVTERLLRQRLRIGVADLTPEHFVSDYERSHEGIEILAHTPTVIEAFEAREQQVVGIQAHPETTGTEDAFLHYWLDTYLPRRAAREA